MFIAVIVVIIGYHLLWLAFKAHAFSASTTSNSITTINSLNRHLTFIIWTSSYSIFLHVFFKCCISSLPSLLACHPWMIIHFALHTIWLNTAITFEILRNNKVYLFASSCITVGYKIRIFSYILINCHAYQSRP